MSTQIQLARKGQTTGPMRAIASQEGLEPDLVRERVAAGRIVIPCNPARPSQKIVGIGQGLRTKVNASIGTSSDICDIALEVRKAKIAEAEGADLHHVRGLLCQQEGYGTLQRLHWCGQTVVRRPCDVLE